MCRRPTRLYNAHCIFADCDFTICSRHDGSDRLEEGIMLNIMRQTRYEQSVNISSCCTDEMPVDPHLCWKSLQRQADCAAVFGDLLVAMSNRFPRIHHWSQMKGLMGVHGRAKRKRCSFSCHSLVRIRIHESPRSRIFHAGADSTTRFVSMEGRGWVLQLTSKIEAEDIRRVTRRMTVATIVRIDMRKICHRRSHGLEIVHR